MGEVAVEAGDVATGDECGADESDAGRCERRDDVSERMVFKRAIEKKAEDMNPNMGNK